MVIFELVIGMLLLGVVLSLIAERLDVPYPSLLALGGAVIAMVPRAPELTLDPDLALALLLAPVLLDAAFDASPRDLRRNLLPVIALAVVLVGLTVLAVAVVARALVPAMSWPVAVTLGAIVAPPDASAASAVLRRLRLPHQLVVILEGESLFNDATALLVYRFAVTAALTGEFSAWSVPPALLLTCGGGVLLGVVLAHLYGWISVRLTDIPSAVLMQFLSTFVVWLLADRLKLSAIVTLVAYAMTLARHTPGVTGADRRIASYAVWDVAVFVLNVSAFVLIGLSLRDVSLRLAAAERPGYLWAAAAVCVTVIGVRLIFWMAFNAVVRARGRRRGVVEGLPSAGSGLVISWCGMRGIVTLAAALALPGGRYGFPQRDFIVLAAFSVVLSTLVLQGLSLQALLSYLKLRDESPVERELRLSRLETARAVLGALQRAPRAPATELLRREYHARLRAAQRDREREQQAKEDPPVGLSALQREVVAVQRQTLVSLRDRSVIGDDAFHAAEAELDLLELSADSRIHPEEDVS